MAACRDIGDSVFSGLLDSITLELKQSARSESNLAMVGRSPKNWRNIPRKMLDDEVNAYSWSL
jgi:hypothetical protein